MNDRSTQTTKFNFLQAEMVQIWWFILCCWFWRSGISWQILEKSCLVRFYPSWWIRQQWYGYIDKYISTHNDSVNNHHIHSEQIGEHWLCYMRTTSSLFFFVLLPVIHYRNQVSPLLIRLLNGSSWLQATTFFPLSPSCEATVTKLVPKINWNIAEQYDWLCPFYLTATSQKQYRHYYVFCCGFVSFWLLLFSRHYVCDCRRFSNVICHSRQMSLSLSVFYQRHMTMYPVYDMVSDVPFMKIYWTLCRCCCWLGSDGVQRREQKNIKWDSWRGCGKCIESQRLFVLWRNERTKICLR